MQALQITDSTLSASFDRENWRMRVEITELASGDGWVGFAELSREGAPRCRITLAGPYPRRENVVASLERRARDVIEMWGVREHSPGPRRSASCESKAGFG